MEIRINENYKISSDAYNIIISKRCVTEKGENKGKEYWQNVTYHPNLEQACKALLEHQLKQSEIDTIFGLKQLIVEAVGEIAEAVKKYGQTDNSRNATKSE